MIQDKTLHGAVSRILQRSERQREVSKLLGTYVDVDLLPQLANAQSILEHIAINISELRKK